MTNFRSCPICGVQSAKLGREGLKSDEVWCPFCGLTRDEYRRWLHIMAENGDDEAVERLSSEPKHCAECLNDMSAEETGDEFPDERICDGCAGL